VYKVAGWTNERDAAVDLYVARQGFTGPAETLDALVDEVGLPNGFRIATDRSRRRNIVLRYGCAKVIPAQGTPTGAQAREVVDALDACRRISDWLQVHKHRLRPGHDR
jgi:hypothetical protein